VTPLQGTRIFLQRKINTLPQAMPLIFPGVAARVAGLRSFHTNPAIAPLGWMALRDAWLIAGLSVRRTASTSLKRVYTLLPRRSAMGTLAFLSRVIFSLGLVFALTSSHWKAGEEETATD
jgi:hypothetical protein